MLGGFLVLWGAALFFGLPYLYGKKVEALVGQPVEVVERELGPPKRTWPDAVQACAETGHCRAGKGPVLLYSDGEQGFYLWFDQGKLAAAERYGAPDAGALP